MTQDDLAEKSGVSLRSISNYEGGDLPTLEQLFKLSDALEVSPAYFLGEPITESGRLQERASETGSIYSNLQTETLENNLKDLAANFSKLSPHERKHVLGSLRAIVDELEQRELMDEGFREAVEEVKKPGVVYGKMKRPVSSAESRIAEAAHRTAQPRPRSGEK